ncbi:hypothetical protein D9758_017293 [Tetrapyrgos nigripes]|uniref:HAT C-terminal dimerisation domain-containing protein n=1 Tax=Tetrapyrgos nigripes TaxID=182062 RepID=A0A8H5FDQ4_9AGAR|nr:hypothetical protein D9758_017293 [Tetrapyrgos nigripes]
MSTGTKRKHASSTDESSQKNKKKTKSRSDVDSQPEVSQASTSASAPAATVTKGLSSVRLAFNKRYEGKTMGEILHMCWLRFSSFRLSLASAVAILTAKFQCPNASNVYNHIHAPTLEMHKGEYSLKFICKTKPSISLRRAPWEDSTGNLRKHINSCDPKEKGSIVELIATQRYDAAKLRFLLAIWVTHRKCPFKMIDDLELHEILTMLYHRVDIPHSTTISRDVKMIHEMAKVKVISELSAYTGRIHFALDGWSSPNHLSILGISLIRYHDPDKMFCTGEYLANMFLKVLQDFRIDQKILAVAGDNVENNSTMITHLGTLLGNFDGHKARVRCFAHIMNLVVKAILSVFTGKTKVTELGLDLEKDEQEEEEEEDINTAEDDELDPDREAFDEEVIEKVNDKMDELAAAHAIKITVGDFKEGKKGMAKVSALSCKNYYNCDFREDLKELAVTQGLKTQHTLSQPVTTRWNTTLEMINGAVEIEECIVDVTNRPAWNKPNGKKLRQLCPEEKEWKVLKDLQEPLDLFLSKTKEYSQSSVALLHNVILDMDSFCEALSDVRDDAAKHPAVRYSMVKGIAVLDKYYSLTDDSELYRAVMIMHPKYKAQYFLDKGWEEDWIKTAIQIARQIWQDHYRPVTSPDTSQSKPKNALHAKHFAQGANPIDDAFEKYIKTATQDDIDDPLVYWELQRKNNPHLAQMGLDYCSVPVISVHTEQSFSSGSAMVSRFHHALNDSSLRSGVVVCSWHDLGFIPMDEVCEKFQQNNKRWKATAQSHERESAATETKGKTNEVVIIDNDDESGSNEGSDSDE